MAWITSRIGRARSFGGVVVAFVLLSVSLSTALSYWWGKLGVWGIGVTGGTILLALVTVILMPETAWRRLTTASTFVEELGRLHAEGVGLLRELPRVHDNEREPLDAWEARAEPWRLRVESLLAESGPRWVGIFNSPVPTGMRTVEGGYHRATTLRWWIDERLDRLSQIMAAVGGRQ